MDVSNTSTHQVKLLIDRNASNTYFGGTAGTFYWNTICSFRRHIMDFATGRPNHIEDYLVTVRMDQWFGWSGSKDKIYANLIVHDGGTKPTEKECTDGLAAMQAAWDLENDSYRSKRRVLIL